MSFKHQNWKPLSCSFFRSSKTAIRRDRTLTNTLWRYSGSLYSAGRSQKLSASASIPVHSSAILIPSLYNKRPSTVAIRKQNRVLNTANSSLIVVKATCSVFVERSCDTTSHFKYFNRFHLLPVGQNRRKNKRFWNIALMQRKVIFDVFCTVFLRFDDFPSFCTTSLHKADVISLGWFAEYHLLIVFCHSFWQNNVNLNVVYFQTFSSNIKSRSIFLKVKLSFRGNQPKCCSTSSA